MYKKTRELFEEKIKSSHGIKAEKKDELLTMLDALDREVEDLSKSNKEQAETIANFAQTSTHEAAKDVTDTSLLDISLQGLKKSIDGFEASHPALTEAVNRLSSLLSSMGI